MNKLVAILSVLALGAIGILFVQLQQLRTGIENQKSLLTQQANNAESAKADVEAENESLHLRLREQAERIGELEEALHKVGEGDKGWREELTEDFEKLAERQANVEAYWAARGDLFEAIPEDTLKTGYSLDWTGEDESVPLKPAGEVELLAAGGLRFSDGAHMRSDGPATRLLAALMASDDFSVFVDFKAETLQQGGPSRILSSGSGAWKRNFTLGQEGGTLLMRVRTDVNSTGMAPMLSAAGAITGERQRVVFVRSANQHTFFIDGEQAATLEVPGSLSTWSPEYALVVANEAGVDRRWQGDIYAVTFYNRALTEAEVTALSTP